ncbi:MAG: adenylate/guanylate cyclase domain-containing protein [Desulfomonilaceae bacterium]|nr:adenylate/guanylate cyclase domain-containing protein [Desulfomonilaceae bacterium]
MIYSLEKRFLVFLLLPVSFILLIVGVGGFFYARGYLLDQRVESTHVKLEKAAYQINLQLEEKLKLMGLIDKTYGVPNGHITQAFLIQQLVEKEGVRFVDIETIEPSKPEYGRSISDPLDDGETVQGLYTMELCGDFSFCAPIMDPNALDRSLRIVQTIAPNDGKPQGRIVVRISLESFLEPIKQMKLWKGSTAALVTGTGQFLTATDRSFSGRKRLGDNGDSLEKDVLEQIKGKPFGTVFGKGHPPAVVIGFYKIPSMNWYIVLFSQGKVIMAPIVKFLSYYTIAGIIVIGAILMLIRMSTRSVGKSIAEITSAAARVRRGDYTVTLPEDQLDDIGLLYRSFNAMTAGLQERDLIEQTFGRYVDRSVAQELMKRPDALKLGGEIKKVTIMMSDIRDFTVMSEKLQPEEVIKILNRYFARMISVIERYKGIIVDFYGDSILVFFNGVETDVPMRAVDALHCALEMQQEMKSFVKENVELGLPELSMGIGIHTGEVIVGNIGTDTRAKYGIVGANVNLTDRIQYAASGGKVVISEETYNGICGKLSVASEFVVCLKGVEEDKKLYEIAAVDEVCENYENHVKARERGTSPTARA